VTAYSGGPAPAPSASASPAAVGSFSASAHFAASAGGHRGRAHRHRHRQREHHHRHRQRAAGPHHRFCNPQLLATSRQATITANVFDKVGNPVQNVPVIFTVSAVGTAALQEFLDSGGSPQYTDSNGQAFDTLRTRAPNGTTQKTVTVTATSADSTEGSVDVAVNYSPAR